MTGKAGGKGETLMGRWRMCAICYRNPVGQKNFFLVVVVVGPLSFLSLPDSNIRVLCFSSYNTGNRDEKRQMDRQTDR